MIDFDPKNWSLEKRLTALVAYFDIFGLGMDKEFIQRNIFGDNQFQWSEIEKIVQDSEELALIDGKVYLRARKEALGNHTGQDRANYLLKKALKWGKIFRIIPFVEYAAVCNYLPLGIAEEDSDIDLFIVARPGRIFLTRFFTTLVMHLSGQRRYAKKINGRFCLSFYANADNLNFQPLLLAPYDIYFIFWILALFPVYDREHLHQRIRENNSDWMEEYFTDYQARFRDKSPALKGKSIAARCLEWILAGKIGNLLEAFLEKYFVKRHQRKLKYLTEEASVEVSSKWLKFHNHDRRKYFRDQFELRLKRIGVFH
jgi:hypothetical protein